MFEENTFTDNYQDAIATLLVVVGIYFICGRVIAKFFQGLGPDAPDNPTAQLYMTILLVYCVSFLGIIVPFTIDILRTVFSTNPEVVLDEIEREMFVAVFFIVELYIAEACVRASSASNYFLLFHHLLTTVIFLIVMVSRSVFVMKLCMILVVFVPWEVGFYIMFFLHRLPGRRSAWVYNYLFPFCIFTYVASRIWETVWLFTYFIDSGKRASEDGFLAPYVGLLLASIFLVVMQFYFTRLLLYIYKKHKAEEKHRAKQFPDGKSEEKLQSSEDGAVQSQAGEEKEGDEREMEAFRRVSWYGDIEPQVLFSKRESLRQSVRRAAVIRTNDEQTADQFAAWLVSDAETVSTTAKTEFRRSIRRVMTLPREQSRLSNITERSLEADISLVDSPASPDPDRSSGGTETSSEGAAPLEEQQRPAKTQISEI